MHYSYERRHACGVRTTPPGARLRVILLAVTVTLMGGAVARPAIAQQRPDTARARRPRTRADSLRADSIARADSLAIVRELERVGNEPKVQSSQPSPQQGQQVGPTNPRLLPDVSAVGDLVGDLSTNGSTQEDRSRASVREVELAFQAAVDPFFRGDVFLGLNDLEKVSIEQAYLTTTALPAEFEARLGRFLMPVGKQNTTHRHDLHTVEYPWVIQRFFSADGLKGTGLWVSKIFAPLGFYQELQVTAVDRFGEAPESLQVTEPVNKRLSGIGYSARLRNYWDVSQSTNFEVSASAITGRREQPLSGTGAEGLAIPARQSVVGADLTYRWRPLQQGLYKSFMLQAEVMRQINERNPALVAIPAGVRAVYAGPGGDYNGGYVFARYQMGQRWFLGARFDAVQDPLNDGRTLRAGSGYYEFFPSEFSKLVVAFERVNPNNGGENLNRILLQASFALGPHKPHPF